MNTKHAVAILFSIYLAGAFTANARLGETPEECDRRYGTPLFKNVSGDLEYRTYSSSDKKITVGFYKSASLIETFGTGRVPLSKEQRTKIGEETMSFFQKLLATSYGFTEEQLRGLDRFQRAAGITRAAATNGDVSATYLIETSPDQKSFAIKAGVSKPKAIAAAKTMSFFLGASAGLEFKHRQAEKANGP